MPVLLFAPLLAVFQIAITEENRTLFIGVILLLLLVCLLLMWRAGIFQKPPQAGE